MIMKICMICLCLGDIDKNPPIGGHESNVVRICKELSKRGHEITIITTPSIHSKSKSKKVIELEWGRIVSLPTFGKYASLMYGSSFSIRLLRELKELHSRERFDVIHGHSGYPIMGSITGLVGRTLNIPSIHTLYCPVQGNLLPRLYLLNTDLIIALSKNTKKSLKRIGIPEYKIRVVPPVVDLELFNVSAFDINLRKVLNAESDYLLLYVGDLTETRGLHVLIKALKIVLDEIPNVKLLMAINIPLDVYRSGKFKIKEEIRSLGLNNHIIPLGIVKNMPNIMATADVFIAPYISISGIADYPISILEAMACGKPVIATSVGAIPEIIYNGDNGIIVSPGNSFELAKGIINMLRNNKGLKLMGFKNINIIYKKFKIEKIIDKLEKIYEEVLEYYYSNRGC